MSHPPRFGFTARIASALVAVMLSGAPRVLALEAPVERHRCVCRTHAGGEHECDCAVCRRSWISAQASDAALPPCHRAAAQGALERSRGRGAQGDAPCVDGTCGNLGHPAPTVAGLDPFCLSGPPGPALAVVSAPPVLLPAPPRERSTPPETPPPRRS